MAEDTEPTEPETEDWVEPFDPNDDDQAPTDEALEEGAAEDVPPDPEQEDDGDG